MYQRIAIQKVKQLIKHFPVVAILGPRQVGKTTLAKEFIKLLKKDVIYLDLEMPGDYNLLLNPELFFKANQNKCIIIDEVQRMPELFSVLRAVIDIHRVAGRFILLGSANPILLQKSSETLAGRIAFYELTGLNSKEIYKKISQNKHWVYGGFPHSLKFKNEEIRKDWFRSFILTYIEREFVNLGLKTTSVNLNRFFYMLAHNQGTLVNVSSYAKSLGLQFPVVANYFDYLENAFLIRKLPPFYINIKKRLVKSPKVYIRDTGILHYLLNISSFNQLLAHPIAGASWEGFVIEQIASCLENKFNLSFYRTQDGTETDLIIEKNGKAEVCIEIKLTSEPQKTKSMTLSHIDLNTSKNFVIIPECKISYQLFDSTTVCSLFDFISIYLPKI